MHNTFDASILSSYLLDSNDATSTGQILRAAQNVADMLKLGDVRDLDHADVILRAGAHRLATFRATTALFN